jgi:hypothetical protein
MHARTHAHMSCLRIEGSTLLCKSIPVRYLHAIEKPSHFEALTNNVHLYTHALFFSLSLSLSLSLTLPFYRARLFAFALLYASRSAVVAAAATAKENNYACRCRKTRSYSRIAHEEFRVCLYTCAKMYKRGSCRGSG